MAINSGLIVKSFIDLFASGRSYAKVILFFAFFAYVGTLLYFKKKKENKSSRFRNISFGILLLISLVGVGTHFVIVNKLDLNLGERILYLSETEITSSELLHTHEIKGVFGMFTTSFHEGIDMGVGALDYVPQYVLWSVLILLGAFIITFGLSVYTNEYKDKKTTIFYTFIFFILAKNSIDGGLLNYEVVAILLFTLTFYFFKKRKGFYILLPLIVVLFVGMFSFYVFKMLETYIFICALYSLLFLNIKWVKIFFVGIVVLLVALNAKPNISYIKLKTQNSLTYVASFVKNEQSALLYSVGNMYIYKEQGDFEIQDLLKKYDAPDNQRPVSVEWKTCLPNTYEEYSFVIYSNQMLENFYIDKNNLYKLSIESIGRDTYKANLKIYSCYGQRFENQVQEGLRELNVLPSIVYHVVAEQK